MIDTSTAEGREKRLGQFASEAKKQRNWRALTRHIGGAPRNDLQDYSEADAGEPPKGAEWN